MASLKKRAVPPRFLALYDTPYTHTSDRRHPTVVKPDLCCDRSFRGKQCCASRFLNHSLRKSRHVDVDNAQSTTRLSEATPPAVAQFEARRGCVAATVAFHPPRSVPGPGCLNAVTERSLLQASRPNSGTVPG